MTAVACLPYDRWSLYCLTTGACLPHYSWSLSSLWLLEPVFPMTAGVCLPYELWQLEPVFSMTAVASYDSCGSLWSKLKLRQSEVSSLWQLWLVMTAMARYDLSVVAVRSGFPMTAVARYDLSVVAVRSGFPMTAVARYDSCGSLWYNTPKLRQSEVASLWQLWLAMTAMARYDLSVPNCGSQKWPQSPPNWDVTVEFDHFA